MPNFGTDGPLSRLLYVSRQTDEGGAVCVWEGGDEGKVVTVMVGAKWESLHTTFNWRHHLTRERGEERETATHINPNPYCIEMKPLHGLCKHTCSLLHNEARYLCGDLTCPVTTESLKYCTR